MKRKLHFPITSSYRIVGSIMLGTITNITPVLSAETSNSLLTQAYEEYQLCDDQHIKCVSDCKSVNELKSCLDKCDSNNLQCLNKVTQNFTRIINGLSSDRHSAVLTDDSKSTPSSPEPIESDALTTNNNTKDNNMGCFNRPETQGGTPCITLSLGRSKTISLKNNCEPHCKDKKYYYQVKNICEHPMRVVYHWQSHLQPNTMKSLPLSSGSEQEISCLEQADDCDGQLIWNYCDDN